MSKLAEKIAEEILKDVTDRRGWRQEYDQFDNDVKEEIKQTWVKKIDTILEKLKTPGFEHADERSKKNSI